MRVEWDPAKARSNIVKHGISFSDVEPALYDEFALSMPDISSLEERFVVVGADAVGRVVVVCYTYRHDAIRIISARQATNMERREYEKGIRL